MRPKDCPPKIPGIHAIAAADCKQKRLLAAMAKEESLSGWLMRLCDKRCLLGRMRCSAVAEPDVSCWHWRLRRSLPLRKAASVGMYRRPRERMAGQSEMTQQLGGHRHGRGILRN